jgi:hypothetical protein
MRLVPPSDLLLILLERTTMQYRKKYPNKEDSPMKLDESSNKNRDRV